MNNSTDIAETMLENTERALIKVLNNSLIKDLSHDLMIKVASKLTGYSKDYVSKVLDIIMFEKQDVNNIAR